MARPRKTVQDPTFLAAALEGLELQKQRIDEQIRQVYAMLGRRVPAPAAAAAPPVGEKRARKRNLSSAARERIAAAQKKRWAEFRKGKKKPEAS
ncbi:MAG: hypothetical protein IANPNBLG_03024 [Bryobacteraceae bacterium]|nr:hypothetical protein [Bryobacteraceae bacterium]MCC6342289.1 hypothetical protein [Bryobacterales bacterium]